MKGNDFVTKAVLFLSFAVGCAVLVFWLAGCGIEGPQGPEGTCQCDPQDFYDTHYAECVRLCDEAAQWAMFCGHPVLDQGDCVDYEWFQGYTNAECAEAADCYWLQRANQHCDIPQGWGDELPVDWMPFLWSAGTCPAI